MRTGQLSARPTFWIGKTGNKYPYHNCTHNLHGTTIRYTPIDTTRVYRGERVNALPQEEYPYTLEYEQNNSN